MSLNAKAVLAACKGHEKLNTRVNRLFIKLGLPLKDKVQVGHYGSLYLFGKPVSN